MFNLRDRMLARFFGRWYRQTAAWCIAICAPITEDEALILVDKIVDRASRGYRDIDVY